MGLLSRLFRRPDYTQLGSLTLDDDVDAAELARIHARASRDARARRAIGPLFEASGGRVSFRELVLLQYLLGDRNSNDILAATTVPAMTTQELLILRRQVDIVQEILGED
jgi:hypothetical protein